MFFFLRGVVRALPPKHVCLCLLVGVLCVHCVQCSRGLLAQWLGGVMIDLCQSLMKSSLIAVCKHDFSVPEKEKTRAYQLCVLDICILIYKRICARILESRKSPASGISLLRSNLRVQGLPSKLNFALALKSSSPGAAQQVEFRSCARVLRSRGCPAS